MKIMVAGIGGSGGKLVKYMAKKAKENSPKIEFLLIDTHHEVSESPAGLKQILIGRNNNMNLATAKFAVMEAEGEIRTVLKGTDLLFIIAGMGGSTSSGAAPIVARIAKSMGILSVGIVTTPLPDEGGHRFDIASIGIDLLTQHSDSIFVIPLERLSIVYEAKFTLANTFSLVKYVISQMLLDLIHLLHSPSLMQLSFDDLAAVLREAGSSDISFARIGGTEKEKYAQEMTASPLTEGNLTEAKKVILCFIAAPGTTLLDIEEVVSAISKGLHKDATVVKSLAIDSSLVYGIRLTVFGVSYE